MIPSNHLPIKALKQATIRQSSPSLGKFSCGILESHTNKAPLGTTIFERRPWRVISAAKKWRKLPSIGRTLHKICTRLDIHSEKKKELKRAHVYVCLHPKKTSLIWIGHGTFHDPPSPQLNPGPKTGECSSFSFQSL